jgi:hypothetical protein
MSRRSAKLLALACFAAGLGIVLSTAHRDATAQPKAPAIAPAPQAPTLTTPAFLGAKAGDEVEIVLTGANLADPVGVLLNCPAKVTIPTDNKNGTEPNKLRVKVALDAKAQNGLYAVRVATKHGVSNLRPFVVDSFPVTASAGANRTKETALALAVPGVATGTIATETSDFYKVQAKAGQKLTFEVLARRIGSPLDPIIVLHDAKTKRELANLYADDTPGLQGDCRLTHTFKEATEVLVEVRDTTYRGGDFTYRLRAGEFAGATTAFPLAAQRGKPATIGFAGPDALPSAPVTAPADAGLAAFYVAPANGWPVPVLLTDYPQIAEQEPNDDSAKANKLPVPGGASGRFEKSKDVDHFSFTGKKGQKLAIAASTYEVNSPAEVLVRVLDAKGAQLAASNPAAAPNRFEFTPPADGDYVIACEHQNFLHGPNEIYHLTVVPVEPDFALALAFDRGEAAAGSGTGVFVALTRLNGFAGPVELSVDGGPALSGKFTVPAGATQAFVPVLVKDGTAVGPVAFRVKGTATLEGGATITRFGTLTDAVKASFGGIPNPPAELLSACALAVTEKPPFGLKFTADPAKVEKGKAAKLVIDATRDKAADGDIAVVPLFNPPTIVPNPKGAVAKGQTKGESALTVQPAAPAGAHQLVFRATTKAGGKDFAIIPPPVIVEVIEPKKTEPKKDEPKKDKK